MKQTIFDILTNPAEHDGQQQSQDDELFLSIRNHLRHLLNARRGSLTYIPDYGMPDITALYQGLPYTRDTIMNCIRQCVEKFEPRLLHPFIQQCSVEKDEDVTQFELIAETIKGVQVKNICTIHRNGSIKVETAWEYYRHD